MQNKWKKHLHIRISISLIAYQGVIRVEQKLRDESYQSIETVASVCSPQSTITSFRLFCSAFSVAREVSLILCNHTRKRVLLKILVDQENERLSGKLRAADGPRELGKRRIHSQERLFETNNPKAHYPMLLRWARITLFMLLNSITSWVTPSLSKSHRFNRL